MSLDNYKLSCELFGHSLDVRAVTEGKGCIISGSRDKTAKIWNEEGDGYVESLTLHDHTNFISSICILEDGEWICTGSNDSKVCVYVAGNLVPFTVLKGHTSTVCALAPGIEQRSLITGSWDKTARIWTIEGFGPSTSITLEGHEAAVWAVTTLNNGQYVTGSADKNIFFWNKKGQKLKVFKGHTDCVRGLIGLSDNSLLSCGNDAVIKYWNEDGECIHEFHGHDNYIYSMSMNLSLGPDAFVSCSEDSTIRMWNFSSGLLGNPIILPAQSVWAVVCLKNGDIVTGTSDGVVRVFTKDPSRFASEKIMQSYTKAVETRKLESQLELGGYKVNELPGPESLLQEGTEGQTRIVRHPDGKIMCYQWTYNEWICLGDVTGASGGSQANSGKVLYEGIEYDFVFNVDISDADAPLKLPYNRADDPWMVAQKFIHKNELPQVYLEQVANFIIKNSSNSAALAASAATTSTGYQDPFTGGSRYIPGGTKSGYGDGGDMVDPFTGASSYRSAPAQSSNLNDQPSCSGLNKNKVSAAGDKHFPFSKYMTMDACDTSKVLDKLREFNSKIVDPNSQVSNEDLANVVKLAIPGAKPDGTAIDALFHLLKWPKELIFPVLDITRLAVRDEDICSKLATTEFLNIIIDAMGHSLPTQLMSTRCFANMMSHEWGRGMIESRLKDIITCMVRMKQGSSNLQVAMATLYLNITISQIKCADQYACRLATEGILEFLKWASDLEAHYRAYQALGNLTCTPFGQLTSVQIISVDSVIDRIRDNMRVTQPTGFEKLNELARDLTTAL